jgi:predicted RNA-binding Zn-ribbon protein involved in translation (DUF1610 family)
MSSMQRSVSFQCPTCGAKYWLTRMEASAEPTKPIACVSCGEPLTAREGEFFLKYFLIERPQKPRTIPLHAS